MIKQEEIENIIRTYKETKSVSEVKRITGYNYRTIVKYANTKKRNLTVTSGDILRVYNISGSLIRTSKILNISTTSIWRILSKDGISIKSGTSSWKRLYLTLRRRVSVSSWRKNILEKYNYKCSMCSASSNTVHHLIKLSTLRDTVVANHPEINPFNSFKELRQFTDLVMDLHEEKDGEVLCNDCHNKEHSKVK